MSPDLFSPRMVAVGLWFSLMALAGLLALVAVLATLIAVPPSWASLRERMRARAWPAPEMSRVALALVALNLTVALVATGLRAWVPSWMERAETGLAVLQTITLQWASVVLIVASLRRRNIGWSAAFGWSAPWGRTVGLGVWAYLAAIPLVIGAALMGRMLLVRWGVEVRSQDVLQLISGDRAGILKCYFILLGALIAPLSEELLFRGLLLPFIARRAGVIAGVLVSAVVFSALHMNLGAFFPIFTLGLVLGGAYVATGRMGVPVLIHLLFNGVNIVALAVAPDLLKLSS